MEGSGGPGKLRKEMKGNEPWGTFLSKHHKLTEMPSLLSLPNPVVLGLGLYITFHLAGTLDKEINTLLRGPD